MIENYNNQNDKEPDFLDVEDDEFDDDDEFDEEEEDEEDDDDDDDDEEEEDEEEDEFVRINFTIPEKMRKKVKKFAKELNLSVSELIRGSLDGIMALTEKGVDLGKEIEKGLKEGLKGLEEELEKINFKELDHLKDFEIDIDDEEYEEKMEDYHQKMEEFEKKMEEYGRKMEEKARRMGEKAQKIVEKKLAHLEYENPHLRKIRFTRPPMPPRAPHVPRAPVFSDEELREKEQERAKLRAPMEKIKMLKELLDEGMITQQDFDEKKKKILDEI